MKHLEGIQILSTLEKSQLAGGQGHWEYMEIDGHLHLVWVDEIDVVG